MFKRKVIINILIGLAILGVGSIFRLVNGGALGDALVVAIWWMYIGLSLTIITFIEYVLPTIRSQRVNLLDRLSLIEKNKKALRSQEELLNLKKLLNEDILTQSEFDKKAAELKKQIL